jgi:hypothetical protein
MRFQEIIKEQREELEKIESSENIIQRDRIEEARDYLKIYITLRKLNPES